MQSLCKVHLAISKRFFSLSVIMIFQDLYLPQAAEIIEENSQIKTFVLAFRDAEYSRDFHYEPGQFMMVSLPHCGEAPISFSSTLERQMKCGVGICRHCDLATRLIPCGKMYIKYHFICTRFG